jgi:hypothetical protein
MRSATRVLVALVVTVLLGAASVGRAAAVAPGRGHPAKSACGNRGRPPARYRSGVVFAFENRTWSGVGPGFGRRMPYLHRLGRQCGWFRTWDETDPDQNSLAQYVGQVTGARQPGTVNDCTPSARCSTRADSIFRQLRHDGRRAVSFVAGATRPCSADHNAPRHVPALYLRAPEDRRHCRDQVRPLSELDVRHLPAFAFVTPNECDDGHDCGNRTVDRWASTHIQPVLDSRAYRHGHVAVFVWYDEDRPVPNLWITPTAHPGPLDLPGAGAAGTLRAWQSMLGLPCLEQACTAPVMRTPARS